MAMKKPVKKGAGRSASKPPKPPKGARYLTRAESKAASKGSGNPKAKDIKYSDDRQTRPGRQRMYSGDRDAKGNDIMVYGGATGFGESSSSFGESNPKNFRGASQRGGIVGKKKRKAPLRGKKY